MCKNCSKNPVFELKGKERLCKSCFIKYFEKKVRKTIRAYNLINKKDRILVACSGGKDSTIALYLLNKIFKGNKVEAITTDVSIGSYSKKNLENLRRFCKKQRIKLYETSLREEFGYGVCYIRDVLKENGRRLNSCTICGVLRRQLWNKKARELKATKLVTGHNLDDEAQSIVMNLFKNNIKTMAKLGPKTGVVEDKRFIQRIKPLYFLTDEETTLYSKLMKFPVVYERCPCSLYVYRRQIGNMLDAMEKTHSGTKNSIVKSFLGIMPLLKEQYKKGKIGSCKLCKEPSATDVCNVCKIVGPFGTLKFKKTSQQMKDESRKAWQ